MRTLFIFFFLLLVTVVSNAQTNWSYWAQDYYGLGKPYSNSLIFGEADGANDYYSGEYYLADQLAVIKVDSNWTASNIGIMVYNPLETSWELLRDEAGDPIEIVVAPGQPALVPPALIAGVKRIKFVKITSGTLVDQTGTPSKIAIETVRYN